MKKYILGLIIVILSIGTLQASEKTVFLQFKWSGGHSPYKNTEVVVHTNGAVLSRVIEQNSQKHEHSFRLNEDELYTLRALIVAVDFFSQPEKELHLVKGAGTTSFTIHMQNNSKTLIFRHSPNMLPLTREIWKLANHAIVLSKLKTGDAYQAMVACSPNLVGAKVYSPQQLKTPLRDFIASQNKRQQVEWALTALSGITSPEEWLGFLAKQLDEANTKRYALLLGIIGSHPFYGNIPKAHVQIELPYLTNIMLIHANKQGTIDKNTDEALGIICQLIGAKGHKEALPTLRKFIAKHSGNDACGWAGWAIQSIEAKEKKVKKKNSPDKK